MLAARVSNRRSPTVHKQEIDPGLENEVFYEQRRLGPRVPAHPNTQYSVLPKIIEGGRGEWIRTSDLLVRTRLRRFRHVS
jgi:hypothetical protein